MARRCVLFLHLVFRQVGKLFDVRLQTATFSVLWSFRVRIFGSSLHIFTCFFVYFLVATRRCKPTLPHLCRVGCGLKPRHRMHIRGNRQKSLRVWLAGPRWWDLSAGDPSSFREDIRKKSTHEVIANYTHEIWSAFFRSSIRYSCSVRYTF